jgi:hypothetical protein
LSRFGLEVRAVELPSTLPAILYQRTIYVRAGLGELAAAWWIWHEAGHAILHVGNREQWRAMACGDLILAKFEQQASDFARNFPDWSDNDATA